MLEPIALNATLTIAPAVRGDAQELFQLLQMNRDFLRQWFAWVDSVQSEESARSFLENIERQHRMRSNFYGLVRDGDNIIGSVSLESIDWFVRSCDLGFWIDEGHGRRGTMTLVVRAIVDHLFDRLAFGRIGLACAESNTGARRIADRLSFQQEGIRRNAAWTKEGIEDQIEYGLTHIASIVKAM